MTLSQFHFAHPLWLYATIVIPIIWALYFVSYQKTTPSHRLTEFIDSHLLPFLLVENATQKKWRRLPLAVWSVTWLFLILALAGPRWDFREIETFAKDQSLIILLDLSDSMKAADMKPSRLIRAKQKIEDILTLSKKVKIGLIAFAADPHMITPITDDKKNILHLLSSLDTDLIHVQGSKLSPALEMASVMFDAELGKNKSVVVISDGGFEDNSAIIAATKKLVDKGVFIHAIGVGTAEGAPLKDSKGNVIKKQGVPILSKLDADTFNEICKNGNGCYFEAHYSDREAMTILSDLEKRAQTEMLLGNKDRVWEEHFHLVILLALPVILWWFRKGHLFTACLFFLFPLLSLEAEVADYFKNSEQIGWQAFEEKNYDAAEQAFQDPYRKGICCYRAGKFPEAEEWFRRSTRPETSCQSAYNLGNALVQQNKLKEAMTTYENVVERWPEHAKAKENLELVKKMLEEQKTPPQDQEENKNQENQSEDPSNSDQPPHSDNDEKKQDDKEEGKDEEEKNRNEETDQQETQQPAEEKENDKTDEAQPEQQKAQEQATEANEREDDANLWLNRLNNEPKAFMKNKFYIETIKNRTTEGINPW